MTIISFRRSHDGSDINHFHSAFLDHHMHILTRSMSSPSSPKVNKTLIAVVVLVSSFILGIFICISFHLRSRHLRSVARNRPLSSDTRREARHLTSEMEMSKVTSDTQSLNETSSSWVPHFKLFRPRHLTPEPFTLTQPSPNVRPPSAPTSPVTPVIVVERVPPTPSTPIDVSTIPDPLQSPRSLASPPAYAQSEKSFTTRVLPTPPLSPKSPRRPSISKKMEISVSGGHVPETVQSPPPAYNPDRPLHRAASANVIRPPRRALPRRPSTGSSPPPVTPLTTTPSSPTASSSRRVLSMALQADSKRLPRLMTVAQTFLPTFPDEVSVRSGDAVLLLEEYGDNWCLVQLLATSAARRGVVPRSSLSEYVETEDESQ